MTHDRTKLQAAALYLRRCMRRELESRPDLLPVLTEALSVIEATLATPQPATAPGLVRAERRRRPPQAVPQTVPGDFRPTAYGPPSSVARTELATLQLGLER